jgi:hypothetical protein
VGRINALLYQPERVSGLLISSFNGKPQATLPQFACGSPLNENAESEDSINRPLANFS